MVENEASYLVDGGKQSPKLDCDKTWGWIQEKGYTESSAGKKGLSRSFLSILKLVLITEGITTSSLPLPQ